MPNLLNPYRFGVGGGASTVNSATGSFLTGTAAATNTVVVTGLGFQPKAIIFWWTGLNTSGNQLNTTDLRAGAGYAVSSSDRANVGGQSDDGPTTSATDYEYGNDSCVRVLNTSGTLAGALDFVSMDSDGFTGIIDTQFASDLRVHYFAVGGAGITNVKGGDVTEPAATGTQATSGLGFAPDALFFFCAANSTAAPSQGGNHAWAFGMAARLGGSALIAVRDQDNLGTSSSGRWQHDGNVIGRYVGNNVALQARATLSSFDSDGFTLNWANRALTGAHNFYLAIKGGVWNCGKLQTETDTVTTQTVSGLGGAPSGIFFCGADNAENGTNTGTVNGELCFGAATSISTRVATAFLAVDASALASCSAAQRTDAVYVSMTSAGALQALMDVQSFDSDGFTTIFDDDDINTSGAIYYMAVR